MSAIDVVTSGVEAAQRRRFLAAHIIDLSAEEVSRDYPLLAVNFKSCFLYN
jgi:hypothetical protein